MTPSSRTTRLPSPTSRWWRVDCARPSKQSEDEAPPTCWAAPQPTGHADEVRELLRRLAQKRLERGKVGHRGIAHEGSGRRRCGPAARPAGTLEQGPWRGWPARRAPAPGRGRGRVGPLQRGACLSDTATCSGPAAAASATARAPHCRSRGGGGGGVKRTLGGGAVLRAPGEGGIRHQRAKANRRLAGRLALSAWLRGLVNRDSASRPCRGSRRRRPRRRPGSVEELAGRLEPSGSPVAWCRAEPSARLP